MTPDLRKLPVSRWPERWRVEWAERSCIVWEGNQGLSFETADEMARRMVIKQWEREQKEAKR